MRERYLLEWETGKLPKILKLNSKTLKASEGRRAELTQEIERLSKTIKELDKEVWEKQCYRLLCEENSAEIFIRGINPKRQTMEFIINFKNKFSKGQFSIEVRKSNARELFEELKQRKDRGGI